MKVDTKWPGCFTERIMALYSGHVAHKKDLDPSIWENVTVKWGLGPSVRTEIDSVSVLSEPTAPTSASSSKAGVVAFGDHRRKPHRRMTKN